jgi:D-glycero-alpha-D-manno-heptose 1-phosphate guanylyltransferase
MIPAIVLAGGFGTRLRAVISDRPKPMALIRGRPFLELLLDRLVEQRVPRIVLAVGFMAECISGHFGGEYRGVPIDYSVETEPLGTGGGVRQALRYVHTDEAIVLNGDTWSAFDIAGMLTAHREAVAALSMGIVRVDDVSRYGALDIEARRVRAIREKGDAGPGAINAGVYLFSGAARARLPASTAFSLERDYLVAKLDELCPLAVDLPPPFIDIGLPEDYRRAQSLLS